MEFFNHWHCKYTRNKLSPIQFMIQWQKEQLTAHQITPHTIKFPYESKIGWRYAAVVLFTETVL